MHSFDIVGYTFDADTYCVGCTPQEKIDSEEACPIFVDSEWDYYPACGSCGGLIDEVILTCDGLFYQWQIDHNARDVTREEYERLYSEGPIGPYDITGLEIIRVTYLPTHWGRKPVFLTDDPAYDQGGFIQICPDGTWYTIPGFIKDGSFHADTSYLQELPPELYK